MAQLGGHLPMDFMVLALFWLSVHPLVNAGEWAMSQDVEIMEGYGITEKTADVPEAAPREDHNENNPAFVPAIRNRRQVFDEVEAIPFYEQDTADEQMMTFPRDKREVIEEEEVKNPNRRADEIDITEAPEVKQWIPQPSPNDDDLNTVTSKSENDEKVQSVLPNPEPLQDKQIGREARGAFKDQWVKLPYMSRPLENEQLSAPGINLDEINHRMPRVNFVTQGKGIQASESRNPRDSIPRSYKSSDLRTDFYTPTSRDGRARSLDYYSYSRPNNYPDEYRRRAQYDDLGYYDDMYYNQRPDRYDRPDPYEMHDYRNSRRNENVDYRRKPYERYDGYEADYDTYNKPSRRIIYYATLPDVARSPPSVYRYSNPYSRYDDDRYYRDTRNDERRRGYYYPNSRYPYSALKKSETEGPKDLAASTKAITADIINKQKKANEDSARAREAKMNSHQYPINLSSSVNDNSKGSHQTLYHDVTRLDNDYNRYDHPSFQAAVDDPYVSRHD